MTTKVAIIGAGPAGLTAGYLLSKEDMDVVVLEADPVYVGGISRTVTYKGFHFDIGGHRFFSKSKAVEDLWTEILPNDMLMRPRSSRIFYGGRFFSYPLKPVEALLRLGVFRSILCVLSWLKARLFPVRNPRNFEEWVSNQFGKRLFNTFFKSYTEKVWGMSCKEISADWAAQRIKGLSLGSAIKNALVPQRYNGDRSKVIKTLIHSFRYPRRGPGMMWEGCAEKMKALGGQLEMGCRVTRCLHDENSGAWTVEYKNAQGNLCGIEAEHIISSAPMRELIFGLSPAVSNRTKRAAESLKYRDFITVMLILKDRQMFDDNWIYIHDPSVKVGRVQNFRSWSPEMVPEPDKVCYGLEYFCFERAPEESVSGLRRRLCAARRHDPRRAGGALSEPAPRRSQRHAQIQQSGSRHDDGDAVRGKYSRRRQTLRSLASQQRRRIPRTRSRRGRENKRQRATPRPHARRHCSRTRPGRVAHASRLLLSASRRNNICDPSDATKQYEWRKSVIARHDHQHARRVRYPFSNSSIGGQEQKRLRSPYTLSMRATAGQNLCSHVQGAGNAACSRE
jgi:protoporphyrinogen oxidase